MSRLQLQLLGNLEVRSGDSVLDLPPSKKTRALLAYLALNERPIRREFLCELFWDIPDDPRGALRWSLSKIRRLVDSEEHIRIIANRSYVSLDSSAIDCDVKKLYALANSDLASCSIEQLTADLAALSEEPLEGLELPNQFAYHNWYTAEKDKAINCQVTLTRHLYQRLKDQPAEALMLARRLVKLLPYEESLHIEIIQLLVQAGRKSEAEIQYNASLRALGESSANSLHHAYRSRSAETKSPDQKPNQYTGDDTAKADSLKSAPMGPSIAVLPFANLSNDPDQEFFADGITEEIINNLTRFPDMKVIARHSTFKYKGQSLDIRDVGSDLGVRYVLEGSVRKGGNMLRVTSQLIDSENGAHLFSETYDRDLSSRNILDIQDDISGRIVAMVGEPYGIVARTEARHAKSRSSPSLEAYYAVLRYYEFRANASLASHLIAREALEKAVQLDPEFSSAWAALASVYLAEVRHGLNPQPEGHALDRAMQAVQRAIQLDPKNLIAQHFLFSTHFHRGEIDEFRLAAERALKLNPNHADMLADYGLMLTLTEDYEAGYALAEKAMLLSPTHPGWYHCTLVFYHYHYKRDYHTALVEAKKIRTPGFIWNHSMLAMCYGQLGLQPQGREACNNLLTIAPTFGDSRSDFATIWNIPRALSEHSAEGLIKAGLSEAVGDTAEKTTNSLLESQ